MDLKENVPKILPALNSELLPLPIWHLTEWMNVWYMQAPYYIPYLRYF